MDAKGAPLPTPPSPNPSGSRASATVDAPKPMLAFHFLRALSRVHAGPARRRTRTISRAAYSSMARAAGPRRAWSRALLRQAQARRSTTLASRRAAVLVRRRVVAGPAPPLALPRLTGRSSGNTSGETSAARAALLPPPPPAPRQGGEPARSDALRRLVPGGAGMEYCSLLEETADYVRCLRAQVQLMQGLADLFSCQ
ncbi:transcription factor IBH1-like [Lolium rigidum]|uniref:transcription factor IBH1-like n=1 Tax=Lolium rigidum TaxID=89674 RepID=UPI001F5D7EA0|nr:transcription factor IBH1-like [Lolium rigidum]